MSLLSHGHPGYWSPSGLLLQPYFHWINLNQKQTTPCIKAPLQSQAALSLSRAAFHSLPALIQWASLLEGGPAAVLEETLPRDIHPGPPQG